MDTTKHKKHGRGMEKATVFVAQTLNEVIHPEYLKMKPTDNIKQASVEKFTRTSIEKGSVILSDGYLSYVPSPIEYDHRPKTL